jgi:sodium/bile acid cotransporter 7
MAGLAKWIDKNFLMLGLITALLIGLIFPLPGRSLKDQNITLGPFSLSQVAVILIFIISGVTLQKITNWKETLKALIIGSIFVLFLSPLVGLPILYLGQVTAVNNVLLQGMALFCAVPTTLSSGVAMVKSANGNVALALILTTVTNLLGVFTMPWSMSVIFSGADVEIKVRPMLVDLVIQTLVPLLFGIALGKINSVQEFATKWKSVLTKCSNCCIFFVVWLNTSGSQDKIVHFPLMDLGVVVLLAITVHIIYRVSAYIMATASNFPSKEWVAVVLMCSQKSLPVCVSVMAALPLELQANTGTMIVPCIMSHFSQLMIDGALADRWKLNDKGQYEHLLKASATS